MTLTACGTDAGYQAHIRRRDTPCESCRAAHNATQAAYRAARATHRPARKTPRRSPCGTPAGYQSHYRDGTPPCEPCKAARRALLVELRAARTGVVKIPTDLLTRLYMGAPLALQAELEHTYGDSLIDRLAAAHDRTEAR
ncbi:hypothetical protein [Nocardia asteroides]|uniref:hypothetical protein n=1 Tax=Nocardia asteroides TaxID=1824 RepID=UPI0033C7A79E